VPKKPKPGTPGGKITGIDKPTHSKLGLELGRLRQLFSERKAQLEVLQRKLEGLEALLENKKTDLFVKVRRSPLRELAPPTDVHMVEKRGYQIVPRGGHKVSLNPVFVEVKSEGYAMYPSRKQFPAIVAKRSDDDSSSESVVDVKLAEFLRRVNTRRKREYLVFLIHPNGVTAYRNIRGYLYEKNYDQVRVGWEPFSRNWILTNAEQ